MDHRDAEALAAEIAYMQDDPSFRPKRNSNIKVKEKDRKSTRLNSSH